MAIKKYSLKANGNTKLSSNFKVKEFACKDGSDTILIADELVTALQKIRTHFGKAVTITSAYRNATYNKKIGGATSSQHVKGTAADIQIGGVDPLVVALYAQSLNLGGVGLYSYVGGGFTHIDVRSGKSRWVQTSSSGTYSTVQQIMPTIRSGSNNKSTIVLQRKLNQLGYACGTADGKCGAKTVNAIKAFQTANKLTADGICGAKTWNKIAESIK